MNNIYNSKEKMNNLWKKLVLLLLLLYAVTCHTITVTNYHFTLCSIVKNVILILVLAVSFVMYANFISNIFF
jgi:hypothetical protein